VTLNGVSNLKFSLKVLRSYFELHTPVVYLECDFEVRRVCWFIDVFEVYA